MSLQILEHPLVVEAERFASGAHASIGQLEHYTGKPYSEHTRAVARVVAAFICSPDVVAAAHLHDTIEDAGVLRGELAGRFGSIVANLVDEVSSKATSAMGNRAARVAYEVRRIATVSSEAKSIKCGDVIVTISSIVTRDPRFARVYVPEKRALLSSLCGAHPELHALASEAVLNAEHDLRALLGQRARP
jgi:guanosine-3',5'-bis(diphosphate) 3'-pyrophosphohydrolase